VVDFSEMKLKISRQNPQSGSISTFNPKPSMQYFPWRLHLPYQRFQSLKRFIQGGSLHPEMPPSPIEFPIYHPLQTVWYLEYTAITQAPALSLELFKGGFPGLNTHGFFPVHIPILRWY
jgi:hypothetical protein